MIRKILMWLVLLALLVYALGRLDDLVARNGGARFLPRNANNYFVNRF